MGSAESLPPIVKLATTTLGQEAVLAIARKTNPLIKVETDVSEKTFVEAICDSVPKDDFAVNEFRIGLDLLKALLDSQRL